MQLIFLPLRYRILPTRYIFNETKRPFVTQSLPCHYPYIQFSLTIPLYINYVIITQVYKKWGHDCCWAAGSHFRSNFLRRIRIRGQNWPITSRFWDIWGYILEKSLFGLLLRLCTGRTKFFSSFLLIASFSTTLSLQNELSNGHLRFFLAKLRPF